MIKNIINIATLGLLVFNYSCSNMTSTNINQNEVKKISNLGYVKINMDNFKLGGFKIKSIGLNDANLYSFIDTKNPNSYKSKIEITGPGISTPIISDYTSSFVAVPTGKNRVITFNLYTSDDALVASFSGIANIETGITTTVKLNYIDTLIGQIIKAIMSGTNSDLASTIALDTLRTALTDYTGYNSSTKTFSKVDPVSLNPIKIANLMSSNNGIFPSSALTSEISGYGTLTVNLNVTGASVIVSDLNSNTVALTDNNSVTVNNITPGKWKLTVIKSGYKSVTTDITVDGITSTPISINLVAKQTKTIDGGVGGD